MNALTHSEIAIATEQGKEPFRHLNPDTAPEGTSINEPMEPPNTLRLYFLDECTFKTFIGGAGI
jgi:hypothetical protein